MISNHINNIYYVYALIDPRSNQPFYIGKGKHNRLNDHLSKHNARENNKKHKRINEIRNSGLEPFAIKLYEDLTEEYAYAIETDIIAEYGREDIDENGILTNNRLNAKHPVMTADVREKISLSKKGKPHSETHKKNLSNSRKGKTWNQIYGESFANTFREINSKPKGPMPEETRLKISKSKSGNSPSPIWTTESRNKLSATNKGKPKPNWVKEKFKAYSKIIKKCPVCGKEGTGPAMQRWHFKNCKNVEN